MKLSLATAIMCSLLSTQLYAQEIPLIELEDSSAVDNVQTSGPESPELPEILNENAEWNPDWEPKMHIFLNELANRLGAIQSQTVTYQKTKTVHEIKQKNGNVEKIPRSVVVTEQETIESITDGVTVIDCDGIDVTVEISGEGEQVYEFEVTGQLILRNGTSRIEAMSAKLSHGKLTLKDVTLSSEGIRLKSDEVELDLFVENLRIGEFGTAEKAGSTIPATTTPFNFKAPESAKFDDNAPEFPSFQLQSFEPTPAKTDPGPVF